MVNRIIQLARKLVTKIEVSHRCYRAQLNIPKMRRGRWLTKTLLAVPYTKTSGKPLRERFRKAYGAVTHRIHTAFCPTEAITYRGPGRG